MQSVTNKTNMKTYMDTL